MVAAAALLLVLGSFVGLAAFQGDDKEDTETERPEPTSTTNSYPYDSNYNEATAVKLSKDMNGPFTADAKGEEDFYTFEIDEGGTVFFAAFTAPEDEDVHLAVPDAGPGERLGGWQKTEALLRQPGTYILRAEIGYGSPQFSYHVEFKFVANGQSISNGRNGPFEIRPGDDDDWFRISMGGSCTVTLETSGPEGDTIIRLYKGAKSAPYGPGELLASDDDGGSGSWSKVSANLTYGYIQSYLLQVSSKNSEEILTYYVTQTAPCG